MGTDLQTQIAGISPRRQARDRMISAGIDAGSRAIKVVLFDHADLRVVGRGLADQGIEQPWLAKALYAETLRTSGLSRDRIGSVVATGYGRNRIDFAHTTITEITCHARGVHHLAPTMRSVVEIGGQDSKIIRLDPDGRVRDFAMNDRCAAGTGRFLEMLAARLELDWAGLAALSATSRQPAIISSTCVVFAETEIIGLLADGVSAADIAAGVLHSIAARVSATAGRKLEPLVAFTGGVALQPGMVRALEAELGTPVTVARDPQFTGALGAALLGGKSTR